ncbi:22718_t:CDS:1, partial [Dentiscutata erythropus]
ETDSNILENTISNKYLKSKNPAKEQLEARISKYLLKPPTDNWIKEFQEKLLKATISNKWAFWWIENDKSLELLYFLNLALQLKINSIPSSRILRGRLLNNAANKLQTKTLEIIKNAKAITLTFDG